jgi:hypothetical protein
MRKVIIILAFASIVLNSFGISNVSAKEKELELK